MTMNTPRTSRNEMRRPLAPGEDLPPGAHLRRSGPPPFEGVAVASDEELILRLTCAVCADNIAEVSTGFRQVFAAHPAPKIVLEMSACPFLDTPGLAVLVELRKEVIAANRTLWIQAPSRTVTRILNLTKMIRLFPLRPPTPDPEGAIQVWPTVG
jgi:anti-anti-sigma factor